MLFSQQSLSATLQGGIGESESEGLENVCVCVCVEGGYLKLPAQKLNLFDFIYL